MRIKLFIIFLLLMLQCTKKIRTLEQYRSYSSRTYAKHKKPKWMREADERISKHRKANFTIQVTDKNKKPIPDAVVKIKLIRHEFLFGAAIRAFNFAPPKIQKNKGSFKNMTLKQYKKLFLKFFNAVGFHNALKYKLKHGEPYAEIAMKWFKEQNIPVRGHTLIWPGRDHMSPELVQNLKNPAQLKKIAEQQIIESAKRWDVFEWDVINEPRGNHKIQDILGKKIMVDWFKTAKKHVKNKNCKLYINENKIISFDEEEYKKGYYETIQYLLKNKAPIDGIGLQSRFGPYKHPDKIYKDLTRFAKPGLELKATEFEIRYKERSRDGLHNEEMRERMTEEIMYIYFSHPAVTGIYAWTFVDDDPWALVEPDGTIKPNGMAWLDLITKRWTTDVKLQTNAEGEVKTRTFMGEYLIIITHNGKTKKAKIKLGKRGKKVIIRF